MLEGKASALEDIRATRGNSRKEGVFVQDFKESSGLEIVDWEAREFRNYLKP